MKKNIIRILLILLIITFIGNLFLTSIGQNNVFAGSTIIDPENYNPSNTKISTDELTTKVAVIFNVIQVIGIIVAVITLMIIGIKIFTGSVEEKANYKQHLVPWVIGAVLVVTGTSVPKLIYNVTKTTIGVAEEKNAKEEKLEDKTYEGILDDTTAKNIYVGGVVTIPLDGKASCMIITEDILQLVKGNTSGDTSFTFKGIKSGVGRIRLTRGSYVMELIINVKEKEGIIDKEKTVTTAKVGEKIKIYTLQECSYYEINGQANKGTYSGNIITFEAEKAMTYTVTCHIRNDKGVTLYTDNIKITVSK